MNAMTKLMMLTGCLLISACVFSDTPEKDPGMTKAQAKRVQNPGEDLCDSYNWYGDGVCDTFCENADPDCGTCLAQPTCPIGYSEVEECGMGGSCIEQTLCGTTIICETQLSCLTESQLGDDVAIAPIEDCRPGYELVESCDINSNHCYAIDVCGGPVQYCREVMNHCEAYPTCPDGMIEVDECPQDVTCIEQNLCGYSILCSGEFNCDAVPTCPAGTAQVPDCTDGSRDCSYETVCGQTIACQAESTTCEGAKVCPDGYQTVDECPTDVDCYEEEVCPDVIRACLKV